MSKQEVRAAMIQLVKELVGDGYVDEYYDELAADFVEVALAYDGRES